MKSGSLSKAAAMWLASSIEVRIADDPGVGEVQERKRLRSLLKGNLAHEGAGYLELVAWAEVLEQDYLQQHGGMLIGVEAKDPYSAARLSGEIADRLEARASVGTKERVRLRREAYIAGESEPHSRRYSRRSMLRQMPLRRRLAGRLLSHCFPDPEIPIEFLAPIDLPILLPVRGRGRN